MQGGRGRVAGSFDASAGDCYDIMADHAESFGERSEWRGRRPVKRRCIRFSGGSRILRYCRDPLCMQSSVRQRVAAGKYKFVVEKARRE